MRVQAAALFFLILSSQTFFPPGIFSQTSDPGARITFRGIGIGRTAEEARTAALNDAAKQAAQYMFTFVKSSYEEKQVYQREKNTILRDSESLSGESGVYSEMPVSNIHITREYPAERNSNGTYKITIVSEMNREELERQRNQYIEDLSQRYTIQIRGARDASSVSEAIRGYERVRRSLAENPVRQSIAFFFNDKANRLENCYDYCVSEISRLGGGIALSPLPELSAQKNDAISASAWVSTDAALSLGQIECLLRYEGLRTPAALTTQDNRIRFQIDTASLPIGTYRGSIEALLAGLSPLLRNVTQTFSFEVAKITTGCAVSFNGDVPATFGEAEQRRAANALTQSLGQFVQNNRLPISLGESGDYSFVITVDMKTYSAGLAGCAVTLSLENKGRVIARSERSNEAREFPASLERLFTAEFHRYITGNQAFSSELEKIFNK